MTSRGRMKREEEEGREGAREGRWKRGWSGREDRTV